MATATPPVLVPRQKLVPHGKQHPQEPSQSFWKRHAGTLVTVGIAALSYAVEQLLPGDRIDDNGQAILSLLLVFVGLHLDQRTQAADLFERLHKRLDHLSDDLELLHIMDELEDHSSIKTVLEKVSRIEKECRKKALRERKKFVLDETAKMLQEVCSGTQFSTLFWNCRTLEHAVLDMDENGSGLLGLSPWNTDYHWWGTRVGRDFFKANVEAKSNGRRIRRIFVCDPQDISDIFKKTVRKHQRAFQEVRLLLMSDSTEKLEAMAVVDDWLAFKAQTSRLTKCDMNEFFLKPDKINEIEQDLERYWKLTEKNDPLLQEILKEDQP
jgi:hypothetical protein